MRSRDQTAGVPPGRGRRPPPRGRAGTLKGVAPPLPEGKATPPREVGNRVGQQGHHNQGPRPPTPSADPPPSPALGASPRTSFLCRKDTLRRTAIRVFSSPSLVPLLAAFMNWVIWAKAEGLIREARGHPGTPPSQGHQPHQASQPGLQASRSRGPLPSQGGGSSGQEGRWGQGRPETSWDVVRRDVRALGDPPGETLFIGKGWS